MGVGDDHDVVRSAFDALRAAGILFGDVDTANAVVFVDRADNDVARGVRELASGCDRLLVILVGEGRAQDCTWLLAAGAYDVVVWRGDPAPVVSRLTRWAAVDDLLDSPVVRDNLVGTGRAWRRLLRVVAEIARFTSASVLLAGESGTGKELVARLIHTLDPRPEKGELVVLDCTTVVPALSGSEFFGHERGAFTGAVGARDGALALADKGTLFLDEVADLPLPLQAQLLRAVQERTYKRVGGNDWRSADFRLVCASHKDLAGAVARGEFRHDLYHRIATWTFRLPSLAERREDIPALVAHFLGQARRELALDPAVEQYLLERAYPGNVRELRHTVQRLADRCPDGGPITVGQIPEDERTFGGEPVWPDDAFEAAVHRAVVTGVGLKSLRKTTEELAVRIAMALEAGSTTKASRRLGVTERALQLRERARRDQGGDDSN